MTTAIVILVMLGALNYKYVGNLNTWKFHRISCSYVETMAAHNMFFMYSLAEAEKKHFRPCKKCRPDLDSY